MTTAPLCPRCKRPISQETARTLTPCAVALHEACSHAASQEWARRHGLLAPRTYRVVGVRLCGVREVLSVGLDRRQAERYAVACAPFLRRPFPRCEIEEEV